MGRAVSFRVSGEGLGVLLGASRHPRPDGAHEHGVEQHQPVDGAGRHDPHRVRVLQSTPSWRVAGFPLRRVAAARDPPHPAAIRARDDGAREHGVRLAGRGRAVRPLARAVPAAEPAGGRGDCVRGLDGDSRDRVRGRAEGVAGAEVFLGDHPAERRSAGTAVTRPGRPVRPERRGLLKPESYDWSLTMAFAFPTRGHDIGHSIWVHDRAVGSIILLPVPVTTILRGPKTSSEDVTRHRHANSSRRIEGIHMNLTLVAAIALLVLWGILVFAMHVGSGPAQVLYALAVVLFARRMVAGAPKFLS